MIGQKQRTMFLAVGAVSFLLGALLLLLWRIFDEFALLVMGPCFMLSGVTWTAVILLAFKFIRVPDYEEAAPSVPGPARRTGGRIRLTESGFVDPSHCFCKFSDEVMRPWIEKRYVDHIPTMELLRSTDDPEEKEIISLISMLDVDDDTLLNTMSDVDMSDHHIIECRKHVRRMLGLE